MPEKQSFEYAVIRVVPKVEREEFLNVGVILYCPTRKYLQVRWQLDEQRLGVFCDELQLAQLKQNLVAFELIAKGDAGSGPIGKLALPERFRWLTAMRSTVLQTSRVHPGLCADPEETLEHLYQQLVL